MKLVEKVPDVGPRSGLDEVNLTHRGEVVGAAQEESGAGSRRKNEAAWSWWRKSRTSNPARASMVNLMTSHRGEGVGVAVQEKQLLER